MAILLKTHKMLWGRSGNRCAFTNCRKILVADLEETDGDPSVLGQEAHVVARKKEWARGESPLSEEERDKYNNLILLCRDHHKIIDDQPETYPVDLLLSMKFAHEEWVRKNLEGNEEKNRDEENYAAYIDTLIELCDLSNWDVWSSHLFSNSEQVISKIQYEQLVKLPGYINSRVWPGLYPELEKAMKTIGRIANEFLLIYDENSVLNDRMEGRDFYCTGRFYKIEYFPQELYDKLLKTYKYHVMFVCDLFLEFTRALNWLFDTVRKYLFPGFRIKEGVLLLESSYSYNNMLRVEYSQQEKSGIPFVDYKSFLEVRATRDFCIDKNSDDIYKPNFEY